MNNTPEYEILTSLAPWFTVADGAAAVSFYQSAFGAEIVYRLEPAEAGFVVRLKVGAAEWWITEDENGASVPLGGPSLRLILTVANPDEMFARAIAAGATEIFPVGEDFGWRLGRIADPIGLHWEIGFPLSGH